MGGAARAAAAVTGDGGLGRGEVQEGPSTRTVRLVGKPASVTDCSAVGLRPTEGTESQWSEER